MVAIHLDYNCILTIYDHINSSSVYCVASETIYHKYLLFILYIHTTLYRSALGWYYLFIILLLIHQLVKYTYNISFFLL